MKLCWEYHLQCLDVKTPPCDKQSLKGKVSVAPLRPGAVSGAQIANEHQKGYNNCSFTLS